MITPSQHAEHATDKAAIEKLEAYIDRALLKSTASRVIVYPPKGTTTNFQDVMANKYRNAGWSVNVMTDVRGDGWWWEFRR